MANGKPKIGKIKIDRNLCIGAASCVAVSPTVFELDSENKAVLPQKGGKKDSGPADRANLDAQETEENLWLAAQSCPTKAILLFDENGNQIYP